MHHPRCVLCKLGGGGYVKTQLSMYPIYYADDMFQPLWAILRSQKYEEKIYSIRTLVVVHILSFQPDLVVLHLSILKLIIYER